MTIDEAKQKLWSCRNINTLSKVECDQIIKEIYTAFESRTCERCKYYSLEYMDVGICQFISCPKTDYYISSDFGCNKFENKKED